MIKKDMSYKKIEKYWNSFYKKKSLINKPTKFSYFCIKFLKSYKNTLFDSGCGNGRDTVFFNKEGINTVGLDISSKAIINNKRKNTTLRNNFKKENFCKFFKKKQSKKFSVYSRFTLHSINHTEEMEWIKNLENQKYLEYLFIETRTIDDELFGIGKKVGRNEYFSDHYRRFIVPSELKKKLKNKFKIIYFKQSKTFARFKKFKPNVLRIIAKRK